VTDVVFFADLGEKRAQWRQKRLHAFLSGVQVPVARSIAREVVARNLAFFVALKTCRAASVARSSCGSGP